ncbi:MAG TPA: hypothetical protein VIT91_10620 [Chthoniobacterales bacterium]
MWHPDLQLVPWQRLAMIRGHIRTRKPGCPPVGFTSTVASRSWVELERN